MQKKSLSWMEVESRALAIALQLCRNFPQREIRAYPIPRGGILAAQAVQAAKAIPRQIRVIIVEELEDADCFIDDILDSGATKEKYQKRRNLPFYVLVNKQIEGMLWWEFPWERMVGEMGPEENIRRLIEFIGDDLNREGLRETPQRVIRSYLKLFEGYQQDVEKNVKFFEDDSCDEMVILRDVEFFSTCEHHMLPFFGKAHIAYVPDGRVIGASKLVRVLEVFSRRLQIQERICEQVTRALDETLKPKGSACVLEAQHFCMTSRGVQKQCTVMVTSSLTGVFREKGNEARSEFLSMIR